VIAIDGKSLRRSFDGASSKAAIHMVSAWATANQISLSQVVVDEKSNEINAIPKLLEMLELSGCLVTIDAMGCQRETHEHRHGRHDDRYYYLAKLPEDFSISENWAGLKAIGMAIRITEHDDGRTSDDVRYYSVSHYLSGQRFAGAVRGHWGIENRLHWQLDVTFQQDQCRLRKGHADANVRLLRRSSLSLLKSNRTRKNDVKNKRLNATWDDEYLLEALCGA
jgi:predicted transposase YbfD/YdcC